MSIHRLLTRSVLCGAAASMALSAALIAPVGAVAQSDSYSGRSYDSYRDCQHDKTGRTIVGAVLGAVVGGVLGSNIAAGGHRGDGTAVGAGVGAVGGGIVGNSTANCADQPPYPSQGYYDNQAYRRGYADRDYRYDAPPPPPAYDDGGGYPPPRYDDRYYRDAPPPPPAYGDRRYDDQSYDDGPDGDNGR